MILGIMRSGQMLALRQMIYFVAEAVDVQVFDPNGKPTWLGIEIPLDLGTLIGIEFVLIAAAEIFRNGESDPEKKKYPGESRSKLQSPPRPLVLVLL